MMSEFHSTWTEGMPAYSFFDESDTVLKEICRNVRS